MLFIWIIISLMVLNILGRPQGILFDNFVGHTNYALKNATNYKTVGSAEQIHFPQEAEVTFDIVSRINEAPKCSNNVLPFCENVESYPYNYLKRILEKNKLLKEFFGRDEIPDDEVAERLGEEDEKFVCRFITKTIFPKVGQNKEKKWKFIINQGEEDGFVQGVQIEICKNMDGQCDIPGGLPMGSSYQTFCKQKFVYRRLLSLSEGGIPAADTFKIPSACCCAYKQNFDFLTRFGARFTPVRKK